MQEVHTWTLRGEPLTIALTLWMLGFQRRLVRRWEWLMLIPNDGRFPHTSHTAAIGNHTSLDRATTSGRPGRETGVPRREGRHGSGPSGPACQVSIPRMQTPGRDGQ